MTEDQIKEKMSNAFISVIANYQGYKIAKSDDTGGVDYFITYDIAMDRNGKTRYIESGKYVDLQLKAAITNRISFEENPQNGRSVPLRPLTRSVPLQYYFSNLAKWH